MLRAITLCLGFVALLGVRSGAQAQQPIKIGVILPFSGQFADTGVQLDDGIKLYMQQHGDTVAGRKIEVIRKDVGGIAPEVAKRLAQELVVRDNADILAGFALTPNALAAAEVSAQAKKFMVVMNAATSIITTKSPYLARTSVTVPQIDESFGNWAAKGGIKTAYTLVSDYGPGLDAESAFQRAFEAAGGKIVGSVRMPVANPGFLRIRSARQGRQSRGDLHLRARRHDAGGDRQGARQPRHHAGEHQDPRPGRDRIRGRAEEHGR